MLDLQNTPHWYALYTKSRFEKRVDDELQLKGYESYLPLQTTIRQWHDRKKKVEVPVFPGYLFVRMALKQRLPALQTAGVVSIVSITGQPSPIHDFEIQGLRRVLEGDLAFTRTDYLPIGQEVEIVRGPLNGIFGKLIEYRGEHRLLVGVEQIGQALSIVVNLSDVRPMTKSSAASRGFFS